MEVFIRDPHCVIEVGMNDYVSHLKQKTIEETQLPVESLVLEGMLLRDEELCCCTGLVDGSVLDLELKVDRAWLRKVWLKESVDLCGAPSELWTDEDFVYSVLMRDGDVSDVAHLTPLLANKAFVWRVVAQQPRHIEHVRGAAQDDASVIYRAIGSDRWQSSYFAHITKRLQHDRNIMNTVAAKARWSPAFFQQLPEALKECKDVVLSFVTHEPDCIQHASVALQHNSVVVIAAVRASPGLAYEYVPKELRSHEDVMSAVLERDAQLYTKIGRRLRYTFPSLTDAAIRSSRWRSAYFRYIPETMQCCSRIVLAAAAKAGWDVSFFQLIPEAARGMLDVVLQFVKKNPLCLQYASTAMQNHWEVVRTHIEATPSATGMAEVPLSLRCNTEVMSAVMFRDACCLRDDSSHRVRGRAQVVAAAMRSERWEPSLLPFIRNTEALKSVVAKDPSALHSVHALHNDTAFVVVLVSMNAQHLQHVSKTMKGDKKVVLAAMHSKTWDDAYLQHVAEPLLSCIDVMAGPIKRDASLLQHASDVIRSSRKIVMLAIESRTWKTSLLQCASDELRADRKLVWKALQKDATAVQYADPTLHDNKELMLQGMRVCPSVILPYASFRLRADEDFMFECVMERTSHLQYASVSLRSDTDFVKRLLVHKRDVLLYASKDITDDETFVEKCVAKYGSRLQLPRQPDEA